MAQSGPAMSLSHLEEGKYVSRCQPDNAPEHVNPADIQIESTSLFWDRNISPNISNTSLPGIFSYSDTSSFSLDSKISSDSSKDAGGALHSRKISTELKSMEFSNQHLMFYPTLVNT